MRAKEKGPQRREPRKKTATPKPDHQRLRDKLDTDELDLLSNLAARTEELHALADAAMTYRADRNHRVVGCLIYCIWQKADELVTAARKITRLK